MSLIFDDEESPAPIPAPEKKKEEVKKTEPSKRAVKTVVAPTIVRDDPSPRPMTEERSALRFNMLLRRFVINGYCMESMLGKHKVWRGEKAVTGWLPTFVEAIDAVTPELLTFSSYPEIGKTLHHQISDMESVLLDVLNHAGDDFPCMLKERIEQILTP